MVSGPVAASLGTLARERWRALGEQHLPPLGTSKGDLWPGDATPDLTDVDVAIARTMPRSESEPAIRECEALYLDSIAQAKQTIYIESQYFSNDKLGHALAERLREPNSPEVVVVTPRDCEGWVESQTMGAFRDGVFRDLIAADRQKRLRIVYPIASRTHNVPTFVHSKAMVVDDVLVRVGSANFSRRSMGVDTECDLAVDAGGDPRV
jgi:phosphatidylserine/phosphatidylglycerophosphate/cardiolipin synthase-like enzyme